MYKRITRNSTILIITIGRRQRPGSMYRKKDFCRSAVAASRLHKTTRRKHARAIQIEVVNEACPRNNGMDGITISSFILYVSVRSDNCFARLNDDP